MIHSVGEESPRLGSALETCRPMRVEDRRLVLGFPESAGFQRKTAEQPAGRETITAHIERAVGFKFNLVTEQLPDSEFATEESAGGGIDRDELVAQIKKEFDAKELEK